MSRRRATTIDPRNPEVFISKYSDFSAARDIIETEAKRIKAELLSLQSDVKDNTKESPELLQCKQNLLTQTNTVIDLYCELLTLERRYLKSQGRVSRFFHDFNRKQTKHQMLNSLKAFINNPEYANQGYSHLVKVYSNIFFPEHRIPTQESQVKNGLSEKLMRCISEYVSTAEKMKSIDGAPSGESDFIAPLTIKYTDNTDEEVLKLDKAAEAPAAAAVTAGASSCTPPASP